MTMSERASEIGKVIKLLDKMDKSSIDVNLLYAVHRLAEIMYDSFSMFPMDL